MKTLNQLLCEKTFNLDNDVNFIYNKYFRKFIDKLHSGKWNGKDFPKSFSISSKVLRTKNSKAAHKINPIKIQNDLSKTNSYNGLLKLINLNIDNGVIGSLQDSKGSWKGLESLRNFASERTIKSAIYHELSHWVDDSLHNLHITKNSGKAVAAFMSGKDSSKVLNKGHKYATQTKYELNAIIHDIKNMKASMSKDKWDKLSLEDLIILSPNITVTADDAFAEARYSQWKKEFLKRINRENLLGKNMKKT